MRDLTQQRQTLIHKTATRPQKNARRMDARELLHRLVPRLGIEHVETPLQQLNEDTTDLKILIQDQRASTHESSKADPPHQGT